MRTVGVLAAAGLLATALPLSTAQSMPSNITAVQNDVDVINYALTLENLEAAFYTEFQAKFTAANFTAAGYPAEVYTYLGVIMGHETAHVQLLTQALQSVGAASATAGTYNFSAVVDVPSYLAYARVLENTGVSAYDGAINAITNPTYVEVAATIAAVEARHAAYLNYLNDMIPFPAAEDTAILPAAIIQAITPFVSSASTTLNLVLPEVRNMTYGAYPYNSTDLTNDLATLNFALTAERLESAFLNTTLPMFTQANFTAAGLPANTMQYLQTMATFEANHILILQNAITSLGGTPAPICTFNFSVVNSMATFLYYGGLLQNTGTSAYIGAANTISNPTLLQVAATITTTEARFAAYYNYLNELQPFPQVTDNGLTPSQVLSDVSPFITCPFNLTSAIPTYPPGYTAPQVPLTEMANKTAPTVYPEPGMSS